MKMPNKHSAPRARSSLRMADGGIFGSVRSMFTESPEQQMARVNASHAAQEAAMAQRAQPSLLQRAQGMVQNVAQQVPTLPEVQHQVQQTLSSGGGYSMRGTDARVAAGLKAAGLRDGGDLQTGHGGAVPGSGQGDKIPAKYEPGEFVVSNDMLNAQPGLEEHLHGLRNGVLQAQGKDPAAVDASQMKKAGLRAEDGTGRALTTRQNPLVVQAPEATPIPGTGGPVNPPPTSTMNKLGQMAGQVMNNPMVRKGVNMVSNVNALRLGIGSAQDADNGDYAGALDKGLSGIASTSASGPVGLAYSAGHAVGEHVINPMLSDETKDAIGGAINSGLRGAGNLFGQKWGVDDGMGGDPTSPTPAAPRAAPGRPDTGAGQGQSTPGYNDPRRLDMDPSRGSLGSARDYTNELSGVPKDLPGDLRQGVIFKTKGANGETVYSGKNVGENAQFVDGKGATIASRGSVGTVPGMDRALIDKTLTNPDGLRWSSSDNAIMAANLRDGVDQYRGTSRQAGEDESRQMSQLRAKAMDPTAYGHNGAARLLGTLMNDRSTQRGQDITSRGQDLTEINNTRNNETALRGQDMTNATARTRLEYEMKKGDRDYSANRSDAAHTQKLSGEKALQDEITTAHTATGPDGKPVIDQGGANATRAGIDTMLARQIADLQKSGSPQDLARAKNLSDNGVNAMDPATRARSIAAVKLMGKLAAEGSNWNPLKPDFMGTTDPRDFIGMKKNASGDYVTRNGKVIPGRFLAKQEGDHFGGTPTNEYDILKGQ